MGANEAKSSTGTRKRGRRTILTPSVRAAISRKLRQEQERPPEQRQTIVWLAHEIQDELRAKGETSIPKLSTLTKALSSARSDRSDLDKPWDMFSLRKPDWSIPPDTLPVVLSFWAWSLHNRGVQITIREAQWAARLSALAKCIHPEVFGILVDVYATAEMFAELPDAGYDLGHLFDLFAWVCVAKADADKSEKAAEHAPVIENAVRELAEKIRLPETVYFTGTASENTDLIKAYQDLGQEVPWEFLGKVGEHLSQQRKRGKK